MSRILAVDWGERRIGLAVSDETRTLARPLPTLHVKGVREGQAGVAAQVVAQGAVRVVLGRPLHMDGRSSALEEKVTAFAAALARRLPSVDLVFWDERLTSVEAASMLRERGERVGRNKGRLDQVAAALLLQSYLDAGCP
ncbi:MAG: Holliday junction resolvase RuvX [Acidobacteriota bacterium]